MDNIVFCRIHTDVFVYGATDRQRDFLRGADRAGDLSGNLLDRQRTDTMVAANNDGGDYRDGTAVEIYHVGGQLIVVGVIPEVRQPVDYEGNYEYE